MISWGHPYGLEYGASSAAEAGATAWLDLAHELGHERMRIVIAHPHVREPGDGWRQARQAVASLVRMARRAEALGMIVGIENHADVTAEQLAWILGEVDSPALGVCLDTANAMQVGDDPLGDAQVLTAWVACIHVKDIGDQSWHPRSGPTSVPLGTGILPVAEVVATVASVRRDCWYLIELGHLGSQQVDEVSMVARDVAWLKGTIGALR